MNSESSTFEMETKNNSDAVLNAISEMRQEFNNRLNKIEAEHNESKREFKEFKDEYIKFKDSVETRLEILHQKTVRNPEFDRIFSEVFHERSVIYSVKADLGDLSERVRILTRSNETALKS